MADQIEVVSSFSSKDVTYSKKYKLYYDAATSFLFREHQSFEEPCDLQQGSSQRDISK